MHDIADFLRAHSPFDTLDEDALGRVAASAEVEFHAALATQLEREGRGTVRGLAGARWQLRAWHLWHGGGITLA